MSEITEDIKQAGEIQIVAALSFQQTVNTLIPVIKALDSQTSVLSSGFIGLMRTISKVSIGFNSFLGLYLLGETKVGSALNVFAEGLATAATTIQTELIPVFDDLYKTLNLWAKGVLSVSGGKGGIKPGPLTATSKGWGMLSPMADIFKYLGGMAKQTGVGPGAGRLLKGGAMGLGKSMMGGLATLGPQMLALTLIMKPISALLEGILEPLEPLIDLFGMVGSILGLLLVPVVQALMEVLLPFMPLLVEIVMALIPLMRVLMLPLRMSAITLTTLMPILITLVRLGSTVAVLLDMVTTFGLGFFSSIMSWFGDIISIATNWVNDLWGYIMEDIRAFFDGIMSNIEEAVDELKFWEKE